VKATLGLSFDAADDLSTGNQRRGISISKLKLRKQSSIVLGGYTLSR
jgi:hypothetical protein